MQMTVEEVRDLVHSLASNDLKCVNDHRINLQQAIVMPEEISVILRTVRNGRVKDEIQHVWLVGKENADDGYRIVMRENGRQFGFQRLPCRYAFDLGWMVR